MQQGGGMFILTCTREFDKLFGLNINKTKPL